MKVHLGYHAQEQLLNRGIATPDEVLTAVNRVAGRVQSSKCSECRVIVKVFSRQYQLSDGSNGDVVLACVDPGTLKVKTVMLQRKSQVIRKSQEKSNDYVDAR